MRRPSTKMLAMSGVLAALGVALMALGTMIPVGTFCCPALCSLLLIPVLDVCGAKLGACWYGAVAILALLLTPDREAAMIFLFLGYYPLIRAQFQKIRPAGLRVLAKLLFFNFAIFVLYALLLFVIGMASVQAEFAAQSNALLILLVLLGNVTFLAFDLLLARMTQLWDATWRKRLLS